jgi:RNA-directed DNA polymerase
VFASNESYDTAILPFASQINYVPPTKANNCPFKLEVIFCVQGAISPLLANLYLDPLDRLMAERGYPMVRYADDFVILTRSQDEAEAALALVRAWVTANGLTLHPAKTRIANCWKKGNGFEFLGYRFERGRRHVRKKSLDKLKETIREKTRRTRGKASR